MFSVSGNVIPISPPEVVDFETEGNGWITIKLKDGTILKVKIEITAVLKVGYDANTGMPIYSISISPPIMRIVHIPKEAFRKINTSQRHL